MNIHQITRKTMLAAVAILAIPAAALAAPALAGSASAPRTSSTVSTASTASTTTTCPRGWGSLPEANSRVRSPLSAAPTTVTNVRTGRHACFDRLVIDLAHGSTGYDVRYVRSVREDGSGRLVPLRGGARLQIVVRAPSYDINTGKATYTPRNRAELTNVTGYRTFRQVAFAGSFEGQTTLGLGVRARLPFRVLTIAGPGTNSRLVVDVAHRW